MKVTRDSVLWTVGLVGGVASALAGHWDLFPWMSTKAQHYIELAGFVSAVVSGKLATSPLRLSPEGKVKEQFEPGSPLAVPPVLPPAA